LESSNKQIREILNRCIKNRDKIEGSITEYLNKGRFDSKSEQENVFSECYLNLRNLFNEISDLSPSGEAEDMDSFNLGNYVGGILFFCEKILANEEALNLKLVSEERKTRPLVNWYVKAKTIFPEIIYFSGDFYVSTFFNDIKTIYGLWFELLARTHDGHEKNDKEFLGRAYSFAEWAYNQTDPDYQNSVAVAFFEHLVDRDETMKGMVKWVSKDIVKGVMPLWEWRLSKDKKRYDELIRLLKKEEKS
jgi:hypothetical protein